MSLECAANLSPAHGGSCRSPSELVGAVMLPFVFPAIRSWW